MKVDIIDPFSRLPCVTREICGVPGTIIHGNKIAPRNYTIAVTRIKKGSMKLPFTDLVTSKIKDMANGVVLWWEKDATVCK
jgi:hypothetical protein